MIGLLPVVLSVVVNGTRWLGYGNGLYDSLGNGTYSVVYREAGVWYVGVGDVAQSAWLGVGISLVLVVISLLLALKSRSWAVNFLFGLSLVGFLGWEFANATTELFGGWLLFMVLVGAVLVLVKGAVLVRASGV